MKHISFPTDNEYAMYYETYLKKIDNNLHVLNELKLNAKFIVGKVKSINKEKLLYTYAPNKWNIKDILQHLIDCERIFCYRALSFARNDKTPKPFFEENDYAKVANAGKKPLNKLLKEYSTLRSATLALFDGFSLKETKQIGIASNFNMSVRACAWIIYAHEMHHWKVIEEKYLD